MVQKFYSEELKKYFDTEADCLAAEEKHKQAVEERKTTKAKLAKNIEDAKVELDLAYEGLDEAKKQIKELQKEYDDKVDAIMNPARERVNEALKLKSNAIKEFNDKYGVYTTTYKGNDAINEFFKLHNRMNSILDTPFFW